MRHLLTHQRRQAVQLLERLVRVHAQRRHRHHATATQVLVVLDAFHQLQQLGGARTTARAFSGVPSRRNLRQGHLHQAGQRTMLRRRGCGRLPRFKAGELVRVCLRQRVRQGGTVHRMHAGGVLDHGLRLIRLQLADKRPVRGLHLTLGAVGGKLTSLRARLLVTVLTEEGHSPIQQRRRVGGGEELRDRHQLHRGAHLGTHGAMVLFCGADTLKHAAVVLQQLLGAFGSVLQVVLFCVHFRHLFSPSAALVFSGSIFSSSRRRAPPSSQARPDPQCDPASHRGS
ncbi:flagellar biosynthesis/type III secretory pathway ATPase [Rothia mucilaginosa DY-18]|uniref:Flagellar biosynthesis/type III secretory pathway ATPase n=1 Tax=Rothia mucilaginosa (strain DY-18) TaxID=680646 RepID=D2NU47_ROTMD|nr:flagellar biosynthesis/type III secretory pathway ATPase [Rothia mucilaginosa DY-18]